ELSDVRGALDRIRVGRGDGPSLRARRGLCVPCRGRSHLAIAHVTGTPRNDRGDGHVAGDVAACREAKSRRLIPGRGIGLTACSGDSGRDPVENTPMIVCVHACGGTDGACHAANDLPGRLSRVCPDASLACPRTPSRTRHHAVSHRCAWRPCPSLSGWSYVPRLVQLLSASVVSAMCLPPDRALVGSPAGAAPGL